MNHHETIAGKSVSVLRPATPGDEQDILDLALPLGRGRRSMLGPPLFPNDPGSATGGFP